MPYNVSIEFERGLTTFDSYSINQIIGYLRSSGKGSQSLSPAFPVITRMVLDSIIEADFGRIKQISITEVNNG